MLHATHVIPIRIASRRWLSIPIRKQLLPDKDTFSLAVARGLGHCRPANHCTAVSVYRSTNRWKAALKNQNGMHKEDRANATAHTCDDNTIRRKALHSTEQQTGCFACIRLRQCEWVCVCVSTRFGLERGLRKKYTRKQLLRYVPTLTKISRPRDSDGYGY